MNTSPLLASVLDACHPFQVLSIILPFLCVLSLSRRAPTKGLIWCFVAGFALYELITFLLGTILGNLGFLAPSYYRAFFLTTCVVLGIVSLLSLPALFSTIKTLRYRPSWIDPLLLACVWNAITMVDSSFVLDWSTGTGSFDSLHYHIPRTLVWSWQGSFAPTPTNIWQQVGHPYGSAATILPITLLGCGYLGGSYSSLIFAIGTILSVFMICRSFGFSSRASAMSAMLLLSCPIVGWRMTDTSTDIAACFPVLAAVALIRSPLTLQHSLFLFPLLVGLGTSIKQYAAFPAVPIALAIFLPHIKEILTTRKLLLAALGGTASAGILAFLSYFPIYGAFGNVFGDAMLPNLSTFDLGWRSAWDSVRLMAVEWTFDPLRFLPDPARLGIFEGFNLAQTFDYLGFKNFKGPLNPPHKETCRAGMLSLLLLPWLIAAFDGWKRKTAATLAFFVVFVSQTAPISINPVGARFAIIPVATFCVLFAARATRSPLITALLLFFVSYESLRYVPGRGYLQGGHPAYNARHEQYGSLHSITGEDTVLLLGRTLSQDALISGRLGQTKFQYFKCPLDNNWEAYLIEAKSQSKWLLFGNQDESFIPGPDFRTSLGPACPPITLVDFRSNLEHAGWKLHSTHNTYGLWSHP
jgi:hypothetical protein